MNNRFIHVGNGAYVNVKMIDCIISVDAKKLNRILKRKGIDPNSTQVWNVSGDIECRSLIVMTDGQLLVSMLTTNTLEKRIKTDNTEE